jgi:hypothetical protein
MPYLLDANVFIQAKNLHYGLETGGRLAGTCRAKHPEWLGLRRDPNRPRRQHTPLFGAPLPFPWVERSYGERVR